MKYISPLISDARGSLGGTTFARNRAGIYTRARVAPTQPRTTSQQDNRANFATLTQQWRTLSRTQIEGWNTLAGSTTLQDTLGHSYSPSGLQLYISCNRNLTMIGKPAISDPPGSKPEFSDVTMFQSNIFAVDGAMSSGAIGVPGISFEAFPPYTVSCTAPLSPGMTFVARHLYRQLKPPFTGASNFVIIQDQWNSLFSGAATGLNIGVRLQFIDGETGYAGLPFSQLVTFQG